MKFKLNSVLIFRIAVTIALSISATQWLAAACFIDFEQHQDGTSITTQYQGCGIVFSGDGADPPPQVYDDMFGGPKILHSYDWYAPMIVSFVQPDNIGQPRPVSYIELDIPTADQDHVTIDVYDTGGSVIATYSTPPGTGSPETIAFDLGAPLASYIVIDDFNATAYAIDNLTVYVNPQPIFRDRFVNDSIFRWSQAVGLPE